MSVELGISRFTCDRCSKTEDSLKGNKLDGWEELYLQNPILHGKDRVDLCPSCADRIKYFLLPGTLFIDKVKNGVPEETRYVIQTLEPDKRVYVLVDYVYDLREAVERLVSVENPYGRIIWFFGGTEYHLYKVGILRLG